MASTVEPRDLAARIRVLEDIEAIKKLKSKYWRCIDKKLWDEIADCFTEDVILEVPSIWRKQGRKACVQNMKETLGRASIITVHQGHNPDIEITSEKTAKGTWALYDNIIDVQSNIVMKGWGFYEDEYVKENGKWKIKTQNLIRIFTDGWNRGYGQKAAYEFPRPWMSELQPNKSLKNRVKKPEKL